MTTRLSGAGHIVLRTMALMLAAALCLEASAATGDPPEPAELKSDAAVLPDDCESAETPNDPSESDRNSFRSGPPDTTPYTRPIVPEDHAPGGKPAIPPGVTVPAPAPDESIQKNSDEDPDGGDDQQI